MRLLPRILTRALTHAQPDAKAPLRAPSIKHAPIPKKPKGPGKAPYARAETHTCWLIDLENVGKAWTEILDKAKPGDTVAVFWSNQAAEWSLYYWNLSQIPDIRFMFPQCETGTHNALDFQLTAWLGRMSVLDPDARFVIVSGDRGYRPLRDFLGKRGIPVAFFDPKAETIKETPAKIPAILSNPIPKTKTAQIPSVEEVRKALAAAGIPLKQNQAERSVAALKAVSGKETPGRARQILNETVVNTFKENHRKTAFKVLSGYLAKE